MVHQKKRFAPLIIALLLLLSLTGCVQAFQDLMPLRAKLVEQYQEKNVNLTIQNGTAIGVSFINSSFNELDREAKARKAHEIALFVKNNYPSIDKIEMIAVAFTVHKNYFVFNYTNSLDTFFFKTDELNALNP